MIPSSHPAVAYVCPIRKPKGHHSIFVGLISSDFRPANPWDVPLFMQNVRVLEPRVSMAQGIAITRQFNREQLEKGIPGLAWAVLVLHCKPRGCKGGAA